MKYILLFCITLAFLASCSEMEEEISWDTNNIPAKAVVEGSITSDTCYQMVRLSQTADYFLNGPTPRITGADVSVSDGSQTFSFKESETVPGDYYSTEMFAGIPGNIYTLNVNLKEPIDGISTLTANDQMIQGFTIDSAKVYVYENPFVAFSQEEDKDSTIIVFYMKGNQPINIVNYYLVQMYRNGEPYFEKLGDMEMINDEYSEDPEETELVFYYIGDVVVKDTISIELISVSKDYYEYVRKFKELLIPPDPLGFSGPPADAVGNINGGKQLGFFYTGQKSRSTAIAQEPENIKETVK